MIRYKAYFQKHGMRKSNDARRIQAYGEFTDIPLGGILHLGTTLAKSVDKETDPTPNLEDYSKFTNDRNQQVWFDYVLHDKHIVQPDLSGYKLFESKIITGIRGFRSKSIKIVRSIPDILIGSKILGTVIYDPLYCGKMTGTLQGYRIFNVWLAKLLTNVSHNPDLDHFVLIHTENINLSYSEFTQSFKSHQRSSIKHPDSYQYLLLMHILGYLQPHDTESLFDHVPSHILSKINFIVANPDSGRCIHIRLDRLKMFAEENITLPRQFVSTVNAISHVADASTKIGQAPESLLQPAADVGIGGAPNVTGFSKPLEDKELSALEKQETMDNARANIERISTNKTLSAKQKTKAIEAVTTYPKISIGGSTIGELINTPPTQPLESNNVGEFVDIPDKSLAESSLANFHVEYMEKSFKTDMAKVLTDMSNIGMYIQDVQEEEISDELNNLVKYTCKFADDSGATHTIKYTMPKVDAQGMMLINGSKKRITIQRINTPICKVSPTRVSISSNANKTLVEMNNSFSNSLVAQVKRIVKKSKTDLTLVPGTSTYPEVTLPRDYSSLAKHFSRMVGKTASVDFTFDYEERIPDKTQDSVRVIIAKQEETYAGVYLGTLAGKRCYMDIGGVVHLDDDSTMLFIDIMDKVTTDVDVAPYSEWVSIMLLNKRFPVIFLLAYRYGFEGILDYLNTDYEKIPKGQRLRLKPSDVLIKMQDITYVIRSPSMVQRLLLSGMNWFNFKDIEHTVLDNRDTYLEMLQDKGMSMEYAKGIDFIFDMFLDSITKDVLRQMREPTNMRDLLIRATVLLTTTEHKEAASAANFRYRSYEQFNAILYKTLARAAATHKNKAVGSSNKFSISEYDVLKAIVTEPTINNANVVNPLGEIKESLHYTHIGDGGRSGDSMMIEDRRFPKDGTGTLSEATVDSGKVGIDGTLSMNATITNTRGMAIVKGIDELSNSEIMSPSLAFYPGLTMDDGKRAVFLSIQISQYIPAKEINFARIRTGYERVVAHRAGMPFAFVAEENGQVVAINEATQQMSIQYTKSKKTMVVQYGEINSKNSSEHFYIAQYAVINNLKINSRFKEGDVLVYNSSYFLPDPFSDQVDMGLGLMTNVALIDTAKTLDDSNFISRKLSDQLSIDPVMFKSVAITKDTVLHKTATVGTELRSVDPLMIFDEIDLGSSFDADDDTAAVMMALNKTIPKATYTGTVVDIEVFYRCEISEMSESLQKFVRSVTKLKNAKSKVAATAENSDEFKASKPLLSDKMDGLRILDDTVIVKYYIKQDLAMGTTDKIVLAASLKSTCAGVVDGIITAEDGTVVDAVMGALSVQSRIVLTPLWHGGLERIMEKVESNVVAAYFN